VNHQPIARNMTEKSYGKCVNLMRHTGIETNSFKQYQKWGTLAQPIRTIAAVLLNWSFWFAAFYLMGGFGLVCAMFGAAGFWAVGVRTYNYEGHGKGEDKRRDGVDHNREDMSINQIWPGYVAGEWHNNHHLYPKSARSGFKPYQLDLAWCYIKFLSLIGAVSHYKDSKKEFYLAYVPAKVPKAAKVRREEKKLLVTN